MKRLLVTAAVLAIALAKPETYRENEDFQYSRSSSDDGTKAGYYGAQRGNMGGNFERSHNMDSLAQHQMSGAVTQVEGELGDTSNAHSGSVYTAANSRGMYGSGRYDVRNLEGRNFQEGANGDSQSHSSLSSQNSGYSGQSSSALHGSGYSNRQAHDSRYQATKNSHLRSNLHTAENVRGADAYDYGRQAGYHTGYQSQSGYHGASSNLYNTNGYGSNVQTRLIGGGEPARVVIRPGSTVVIPVSAQTYDRNHAASAYDHNSINSEAEVLSNAGHHTDYRPSNDAKNYESSYSYRKQWEKHDTVTAAVPSVVPLAIQTENPIPRNSELYDESRALHTSDRRHQARTESQNAHSSNSYSGYNSNVKSTLSSQSRYNSGYNAQHSGANSNAYTNAADYNAAATNALLGDAESKPKSYQSAYSYHKSWERQGDPYVIYPVPNSENVDQASQRLTAASANQGYSSHQHNTQAHQSYTHGSSADCDENGHTRVVRSYNVAENQQVDPYQQSQIYDGTENLGQQAQTSWGNSQQSQKLEDFRQESQNLEDFGQQSQNLEDLGQQAQNSQDFGQQSQNLEDFGQQSQNLEDFGQQNQNLEDLGQQAQNSQDFGQQSQNLEDFGQQNQNLEDLGQQAQNSQDFGQQSQNLKDLGQQSQNLGQQTQNQWDYTGQNTRGKQELAGQQTETEWNNLDDLGQQTQPNLGQQTQDTMDQKENVEQLDIKDFDQHTQSKLDNQEDLGQHVQEFWYNTQHDQKQQNSSQTDQSQVITEQESQQSGFDWFRENKLHSFNQHSETNKKEHNASDATHQTNNIWDRLDGFISQNTDQNEQKFEQESQSQYGQEDFDQQNSWHQTSQNEYKDLGQQTQDTWSNFDILSQHNEGANRDTVKPVWEQSHSQQVPQTTGSFSNGHGSGYENPWSHFIEQQQQSTDSRNQQSQSSHGHSYWNTNTGQSSYNNMEDTNFTSHIAGYHPKQSPLFTETTSTSTTTTVKPKDLPELTYQIENSRPEDVGRGDIGNEDSPVVTANEKPNTIIEKNVNSPIFTPDSNNKQYKTPEEIEILSLTKDANKTTNIQNYNQFANDQNIQQSDNTDNKLSVLSLNEQKRIEEQRQHEGNQNNYVYLSHTTSASTSTPRSTVSNTNNHNYQNEQREHQGFDKQDESRSDYNQSDKSINRAVNQQQIKPVPDSQYKPKDNIEDSQRSVGIEQAPEELEQQNMEDQFEDQGQFEQQSDKLNEQSHTGWEPNLEDFGQQVQTGWKPSEDLQQSDMQQFEKFGRSNEGQYQTQDFYNQRYQPKANEEQHRSRQVESLQLAPESKHKNEDIQLIPAKNRDVEIISPPEPTTEKPGFWKSVGSKFTSAKDKVASWFKS